MKRSVLLVSTVGTPIQYAFMATASANGVTVISEKRVAGRVPLKGPALQHPTPEDIALLWLNSQVAKLRRSPSRFVEIESLEDMIGALFGL